MFTLKWKNISITDRDNLLWFQSAFLSHKTLTFYMNKQVNPGEEIWTFALAMSGGLLTVSFISVHKNHIYKDFPFCNFVSLPVTISDSRVEALGKMEWLWACAMGPWLPDNHSLCTVRRVTGDGVFVALFSLSVYWKFFQLRYIFDWISRKYISTLRINIAILFCMWLSIS